MNSELKTDLIVALDSPRGLEALMKDLSGLPLIYKVGSETFLAGGRGLVENLVKQGFRVFLDLKFYDIPNQIAGAVEQAAEMGVEMLTVHLSGGRQMISAIHDRVEKKRRPRLIGVSVLTSFDEPGWSEVSTAIAGQSSRPADSVQRLCDRAQDWGLDGIVCSPHEVQNVRRSFPSLFTVVPGIRPVGTASQDQARVMTPVQAHQAGAQSIVVGRPITQASSPRAVVESILKELE